MRRFSMAPPGPDSADARPLATAEPTAPPRAIAATWRSPLAGVAGPIAVGAGVLLTITQLLQLTLLSMVDRETSTWREVLLANPLYVANGVGQSVAMCVLLIALVAAYDRQADAGGTLGVVGVGAAVLGTVHLAGNYWFEAFVTPWLATVAPRALPPFTQPSGTLAIGGFSSYVLFALGWLLFGIAGLRARVLPAAISLAIMVGGMLGFFALMPPFGAPLGLAVAASGAWMLRTRPAGSLNPIAHASPT